MINSQLPGALATGLSALLLTSHLHAAPTHTDWQNFNRAAIDQHVIPGYADLSRSSANLAKATHTLCQSPSASQLQTAQQAFTQTMASWQGIQHIQFGPVTLLMRNHGLQYWPDKKNIGGKQLSQALADQKATFNEDYFLSASISLKGFPAMEKLLFSPHYSQQLLQPDSRQCQLLSAIAEHVAGNSRAITQEWQEYKTTMLNPEEEGEYESHEEAATALLKALVEPIEAIRDNKLNAPLGKGGSRTRWRKSESWRSGLSIANIAHNLDALHQFFKGTTPVSVYSLLVNEQQTKLADTLDKEFKAISAAIGQLKSVNNLTVSDTQKQQMLAIAGQLRQLQHDLEQAMQLLDIQLGFNSRDGD